LKGFETNVFNKPDASGLKTEASIKL